MGFRSIQKSTFIIPYPSKDEIEFITHFYRLEKYVLFLRQSIEKYKNDVRSLFNIKSRLDKNKFNISLHIRRDDISKESKNPKKTPVFLTPKKRLK